MRTPALQAWTRDVVAARRKKDDPLDALWAAACWEQSAREAASPETAKRFLAEARRILRDAVKGAAA